MLGNLDDVRSVVLDEQVGVLKHMRAGSTLIDHTTSSPELAEVIFAKAKERGIEAIDAPVSGGEIGARNGKLVVMAGGTQEGIVKVRGLLQIYAQEVQHMGPAKSG